MTYIPIPLRYPPERARDRIRECVALLSEPGKVQDVTARALYWRAAKSAYFSMKQDATPCDVNPKGAA